MLIADLYLDRIDLAEYVRPSDCRKCSGVDWKRCLSELERHDMSVNDCPYVTRARLSGLKFAVRAAELLPEIPSTDIPKPCEPGLFELNGGGPAAPILVTGNSQYTVDVMLAVLATSTKPVRLNVVNTDGHTVDMAMIFETLTAERVADSLAECRADGARVVLPGLARPIRDGLAQRAGLDVVTGPVCAAELPLFFGERW